MIRVTAVEPGTIGAELGLEPGSELLSVNGRELEDFLDWEYPHRRGRLHPPRAAAGRRGDRVRHRAPAGRADGSRASSRPASAAAPTAAISASWTAIPQGLRDVLYIRDDDYRLSFRYGNFATLTNLKPRDVERIIEYRLSPLYVSVHATDPVVRRWLLRNPTAPDILPQLRQFADHGIEFHTQIVMSPGRERRPGAGADAARSLRLRRPGAGLSRWCRSGLTEYSKHQLVREPTADECRAAIGVVEARAGDRPARAGRHLGVRRRRALPARRGGAAAGRGLRRVRAGGERRRLGALAAARRSRARPRRWAAGGASASAS